MFSFNAPQGACPECNGIGVKMEIDPDLIIPNKNLSLNDGAVTPWAKSNKRENYYHQMLEAVSKHFNFSMDTPFNELTKEQQDMILYGCDDKIPFHLNVEINLIRLIVNLKELFREWNVYTLKLNQITAGNTFPNS